jgi:O-antigen ligase
LFPDTASAWSRLTLASVCALAICVSLGTALVSLSKALLLLAFMGQVWLDGHLKVIQWLRRAPKTVWLIGTAITWFALTMIWSEAPSTRDALTVLYGHARLVWLVVALYLVATPERAWVVLLCLMGGQAFVVTLSWLLWLGVPVGWIVAKYPPELGVAFTSTLEQPVMETLLVVLLWGFRDRLLTDTLPTKSGKYLLYAFISLTVTNVFFVMTGRTGYLVMMLFLSMLLIKAVPKKTRLFVLFLPILAVFLLLQLSDRFQHRVLQVRDDVTQYERGNLDTSQGTRLDNWRVALRGIEQSPWMGHGVGSFAKVYEEQHGHENRTVRDPHQQYLFWWVEGGILGIALLLGIFGALLKDSNSLSPPANWSLVCTTAIAAAMALANCPFFGAGMGEFFLIMMAALLGMPSTQVDQPEAGYVPAQSA